MTVYSTVGIPCSSTVCELMSPLSEEQHEKQLLPVCVCVRVCVYTAYEAAVLAEAYVLEWSGIEGAMFLSAG